MVFFRHRQNFSLVPLKEGTKDHLRNSTYSRSIKLYSPFQDQQALCPDHVISQESEANLPNCLSSYVSLSPLKKNVQLSSCTGLVMFLDVAMLINKSVRFPSINLTIISSYLQISEGRRKFPLVPAKTITIFFLYSWQLMALHRYF